MKSKSQIRRQNIKITNTRGTVPLQNIKITNHWTESIHILFPLEQKKKAKKVNTTKMIYIFPLNIWLEFKICIIFSIQNPMALKQYTKHRNSNLKFEFTVITDQIHTVYTHINHKNNISHPHSPLIDPFSYFSIYWRWYELIKSPKPSTAIVLAQTVKSQSTDTHHHNNEYHPHRHQCPCIRVNFHNFDFQSI